MPIRELWVEIQPHFKLYLFQSHIITSVLSALVLLYWESIAVVQTEFV